MKKARRTIPIKVEPGAGLAPEQSSAVRAALNRYRETPGALLPILHAVQDALRFIPDAAVGLIADALNVSRAEVHGVVSFYHYFRTHPVGRHIVYLCRAEACQALGARALEAHAKKSLGIDFHGTTADEVITLEPVYCLGNCGCGPSVLMDADQLHARVTPETFDALVAAARTRS